MINIPENYDEYVKILESTGFYKQNEIDIITQDCESVTLGLCEKGQTNRIINIRCPRNKLWVISSNNSVSLEIKDETNREIDKNFNLLMCHIRPSEFVNQILRQTYYNFKHLEWKNYLKYFKIIHGEDHIIMTVLNSPINILKENITFKMTFDCWSRSNK